jgi:histidyl-tRNA synthetase
VAQRLRLDGIPTEIAYKGNLKRRMERANKQHAIAAILIGEEEAADGLLVVKDLDGGGQQRVPGEDLTRALAEIGVLEAMALLIAQDLPEDDEET